MTMLALATVLSFSAQANPSPATATEVRDFAALSRGFEAVADLVRPSVVQILTTRYGSTAAPEAGIVLSRQRTTGSGVIVDSRGYIVTNAHVVEGARSVQVVLAGLPTGPPEPQSILRAPGRIVKARVIGLDRETDVAVLHVDEIGLPALAWGDSERLRPGQLVLAFGSPFGLENSVTMGVVSAVARQIEAEARMIYIQTDASINPGNSGGPLVDSEGKVVGINTLILSESGGNEGVGFAAPAHVVRNIFQQIRDTGIVQRGAIGAHAQTVVPVLARALRLPQPWGVVLSDVTPLGPAAVAGLRVCDLVLRLDGKVMENARQFDVNIYSRAVGSSVGVEVFRGGQTLSFIVPVKAAPGDKSRFADLVTLEKNAVPRLGILGLDVDEKLAKALGPLRASAGVLVAGVSPDGPSWRDPLEPGDVIYTLNDESVMTVERLRTLLSALKPGDAVVLQVEREGGLRLVAFEIE